MTELVHLRLLSLPDEESPETMFERTIRYVTSKLEQLKERGVPYVVFAIPKVAPPYVVVAWTVAVAINLGLVVNVVIYLYTQVFSPTIQGP